jgi:hypothetical protein
MRNPIFSLVAVLTIALIAACGPSGTQVKAAKEARYTGDKAQLFAAMKGRLEGKYKVHDSNEQTLTVTTKETWYQPDGTIAMVAEGDTRHMPDRALNIILVAQLLPEGSNWVVQVHPIMKRFYSGRPNLDAVPEEDPSVPGFAHDKVDTMASEIHEALAQFEVKQMPEAAPPPAGGPSMGGGGGY